TALSADPAERLDVRRVPHEGVDPVRAKKTGPWSYARPQLVGIQDPIRPADQPYPDPASSEAQPRVYASRIVSAHDQHLVPPPPVHRGGEEVQAVGGAVAQDHLIGLCFQQLRDLGSELFRSPREKS